MIGAQKRSGWQDGRMMFLATLIATLVLGYTPDVNGLVNWFLARMLQTGAFLSRGHHA